MFRRLLRLFGLDPQTFAPSAEPAGIGDPPAAPSFAPSNPLETALVAAAQDPRERAAFQRLILTSPLFAASPDLPASRGTALPAGLRGLRLVQTEWAGDRLPVLFTSQARLLEVLGQTTGFFVAEGERMIALVAARGALLNPGLGYGVRWTPDDCATLLGRPVKRRREEDVQLLLGAPGDPPEPLVAALRDALAGDSAIVGAWLALAQWPGSDGLAWYLDVRTTLDRAEVERRLEPVFRVVKLDGRALDLVVVPPGGEGAGIALIAAD